MAHRQHEEPGRLGLSTCVIYIGAVDTSARDSVSIFTPNAASCCGRFCRLPAEDHDLFRLGGLRMSTAGAATARPAMTMDLHCLRPPRGRVPGRRPESSLWHARPSLPRFSRLVNGPSTTLNGAESERRRGICANANVALRLWQPGRLLVRQAAAQVSDNG
jgi:hypothetical protein